MPELAYPHKDFQIVPDQYGAVLSIVTVGLNAQIAFCLSDLRNLKKQIDEVLLISRGLEPSPDGGVQQIT